jgi:hypothetical protein
VAGLANNWSRPHNCGMQNPATTITFEPLPDEKDDAWRVAATFPDGRTEYVTGFMNVEVAVDWIGSPLCLEWLRARGYQ